MARRGRGGKQATVTDVAERAGVSLATAARVLRSEPTVNKELAQRVHQAAAELNYVPNMVARNLRRGSGNTIGCVIGEMLDPYFAEIADQVRPLQDDQRRRLRPQERDLMEPGQRLPKDHSRVSGIPGVAA